jgi:hypothetical protein
VLKTAIASPISASGMSRFHRMSASRKRVWAPPESPVRIEYSDEVLRQAARHEKGMLYGVRNLAEIRVLAARREAYQDAASPNRLELLGTFAFRARGEVFLTEINLHHLERAAGSIALVIAGPNAGFFVYQPDGAIQTIKSYLEFPLTDRPPAPAPRRDRRKLSISLACIALLAAPLIAHTVPRSRPLNLNVHEYAGQLRISWNPDAFASARLEISDGADRTWIPVPHDLASATYVPLSGNLQIRLTAGDRSENVNVIGIDKTPALDNRTALQISALESEAESLRVQLAMGRKRAASLERKLATLEQ